MDILGISAFYHDSAAALIRDGEVIAAAQEERFSRIKHDYRFPTQAINYCLKEGKISPLELDFVAFYEKPFLKFERIIESYLHYAPKGLPSFIKAIPIWVKQKLWIKSLIKEALPNFKGEILFPEHHRSHAASAFFMSPFKKAAIVTADGVGEWTTTSIGLGVDNKISILKELQFPHSLGMLYSAFTYYTGFKVNSDEYKVMGLAPYGEPKFVQIILENLIDLKEDGSFHLNLEYFNFPVGLTMTNRKFHHLFNGPPREPDGPISQKDMDLARSIQEVTEIVLEKMCINARKETGADYLVLAGGVALNCVANGKLLRKTPYKDIWVQPAAGDAGGALGAALSVWYEYLGNQRLILEGKDAQKGSFLGCEFTNPEIQEFLEKYKIPYHYFLDEDLIERVAELLIEGKVVGWFQGRMEFGPRALGARSILGDPRLPEMQRKMNLKIKFRESFRPFAPSILVEDTSEYFDFDRPSPYMLFVADVAHNKRLPLSEEEEKLVGLEKLNVVRSKIPAVTHVDYSARIQTVDKETNPRYYALLKEFKKQTGCPVLLNTSFNLRGEPIVCTPLDAYKCFIKSGMDYLVMGNYLLDKKEQLNNFSIKFLSNEFSLKKVNLKPDKIKDSRELRKFGIGLSVILGLFGTFQWIRGGFLYSPFYLVAGSILLLALIFPIVLSPIFFIFHYIGKGLGWIMTRIILSMFFFSVITPISFFSRLFGKQYLDLKFKKGETTYWKIHQREDSLKRCFEKQF